MDSSFGNKTCDHILGRPAHPVCTDRMASQSWRVSNDCRCPDRTVPNLPARASQSRICEWRDFAVRAQWSALVSGWEGRL